jgi:hypothetical protein
MPELVLKADGSRYTFEELATGKGALLERVMRAGTAPAFEDLVGWEWDGANSAMLSRLIGAAKFKKGFYEGPPLCEGGPEPFIQGYNINVRGGGLDQPWQAKPSDEAPKRWAFYRVHAPVPGSRWSAYENALVLDYGLGGSWSVASPLRDYLVQVYPDDRDLLLGKAGYNVGVGLVHLSYFVLRRANQHDFHG